jgi:hypothetical protein
MRAFLADVVTARSGSPRPSGVNAEAALESHLLAFAADEARRSGSVVAFPTWRAALERRIEAAPT